MNTSKLCAGLTLEASYYNLIVSRWEPIFEESSLTITIQTNEYSNLRTLVSLEMNQNTPVLNLNISKELILVIFSTLKSWEGEKSKMRKGLESSVEAKLLKVEDFDENEKDLIQYVSPYTIRNYTGYQI